jgi:hypothetical protein
MVPPSNLVWSLSARDLDQKHLLILLRYFSVPSEMTAFLLGLSPSDPAPALRFGHLVFWQNLLTDLRESFFPFSIKPVETNPGTSSEEMTPYASSELELYVHKIHLKDRSGRHIPFLLSLAKEKVPFCVLTRYLVFNSVTGMMHLYYHE